MENKKIKKCCGNCKNFKNENIDGLGQCEIFEDFKYNRESSRGCYLYDLQDEIAKILIKEINN